LLTPKLGKVKSRSLILKVTCSPYLRKAGSRPTSFKTHRYGLRRLAYYYKMKRSAVLANLAFFVSVNGGEERSEAFLDSEMLLSDRHDDERRKMNLSLPEADAVTG
jgi:hypothetical protein